MGFEGVPKEMKAVQVVEFNKPYKIHQVPTPSELGDHEVLLKTAVASLCHTDSMVVEGKFPTRLPCTGSHEGTGVVVASCERVLTGFKVNNLKKGDRVMAGIMLNECQSCPSCKRGNDFQQYCPNVSGLLGVIVNGAFAEYHVSDSRTSCKIPDNVSFAAAAPLACAGCTIYRAILTSGAEKGSWLGLVGAGGGLGHLGIQFAKAKGINVVAVDARDAGIELCKSAGAEHVLDAREGKDEVVKRAQALTNGQGVDCAVNVSEHETSAGLACAITKMHGTMIQVAQPPNVSVPFHELVFRDIRIRGTLVAGQEISQEMLNEVGRSGIHVETQVFKGLDKVPDMVELAHSGSLKGKAVCVVNQELVDGDKDKV
ncbi:uncharacterized protein HMPREF1541_08633 [Cyphellophora europaea CBS 101466]|uniref:Enoyl reductase (ER) domain-containing protein n=1 Tax=Cyphellophora europaea (strain CBS 101466) TaxID=1220924 RepID=W2RIQ9_CYPE1|nr:uncharacterized protein HMPREF1541_08633 [Cyphellophora europaea CBS 101466]ETN36356.1 hypothetical protein HMPREF1541_08633 [Cyphellophora europaea CBS 101466]